MGAEDVDRVYERALEARDANFSAFGPLDGIVLGRLMPLPGSVRALRLATRAEPPAVLLFTDGRSPVAVPTLYTQLTGV